MSHDFSNVKELSLHGGRLFLAPTKTKDVVSFEGSVLGGPNFYIHQNEMLPVLAAELLDAGTVKQKKEAIREGLAGRGATLSFSSVGDRTYFSGHCFPEDTEYLLKIIAECLGNANFPEKEVGAAKARELGKIAEEKTDTNVEAHIALTRLLYDPSHVNYGETLQALEKQVKNARRSDLAEFRKRIGRGGLILAVTGDISVGAVEAAAHKAFRSLSHGTENPTLKRRNPKAPGTAEKKIFIADKANVDVYLGASVQLVKTDPLYHAALLVADMLGGGFAGHLMQTVRERDGLTYRTFARLNGLGDGADGHLEIYASFNPERYEESVEKLRREVREFFDKGITEDALMRKKEEVVGSYLVSLSTTRGLAHALHQVAADGRPLSYLSDYPNTLQKVSLKEARRAADMVPLSRLSLAAAGTFPKK